MDSMYQFTPIQYEGNFDFKYVSDGKNLLCNVADLRRIPYYLGLEFELPDDLCYVGLTSQANRIFRIISRG